MRPTMLTLTYQDIGTWEPGHITQCLDAIKKYQKRKGLDFRYVWVAELQKRGAVHYHVIFWRPYGQRIPMADKRGWWKHGSTNIKTARRPIGYIMKYASKLATKQDYPKGLRMCGAAGLSSDARLRRAWQLLPAYIRARWPDYASQPKRHEGGGWQAHQGTERMPSAWYRDFSVPWCIVLGRKNIDVWLPWLPA